MIRSTLAKSESRGALSVTEGHQEDDSIRRNGQERNAAELPGISGLHRFGVESIEHQQREELVHRKPPGEGLICVENQRTRITTDMTKRSGLHQFRVGCIMSVGEGC